MTISETINPEMGKIICSRFLICVLLLLVFLTEINRTETSVLSVFYNFCGLRSPQAWEPPLCFVVDVVSGELQACQPSLGVGEGYGADHSGCHRAAHTGQPGDQAQPAWAYERQVLLDQPDLLL